MPDVVFYLVVHPEEAGRRRMERSTMVEMYEDADLQERIAEQYEGLLSGLDGVRIFMIDGSMSERDVHAACMERLGELERP
jgi:thymidylate kinase